jgi:hypothetical protein
VNENRDHLLEAAGLRVRFFWHGDRFAHDVWIHDAGQWICALQSVEGSPEDDWPPSPPFQSLNIEPRNDDRFVALLVGMAGKSHWSASAAIDLLLPCVHFDVACRVPAACAPRLSSAYRTARGGLLEIEPVIELGPTHVESCGEIVRVSVPLSPHAAVRTIRWGYRLRPAIRLH